MESKRQPLKRLCSDAESDSPRKKLFDSGEDIENRDPEGSEAVTSGNQSSLLRRTEQEIKPDTPAIPSVRSRIERLQEITTRVDRSLDTEEDEHVVSRADKEKGVSGRLDLVLEGDADTLSESGTVCWEPEDRENNDVLGEALLPLAQSTLAPHRSLPPPEDTQPSVETASRLRKERQEELAMVCAVLDHSNPWRAASMRHKKRRLEHVGEGSEVAEMSLEDCNGPLDGSQEPCVSYLEVRLRRPCDSGSLPPEEPPYLCDARDEGKPEEAVDNADADHRRVTMNSSEIIDRIFEGVLDVSEASEDVDLELPPSSVVSNLSELLEEERTGTSAEEEVHLPYSVDTYRTMRSKLPKGAGVQWSTPIASCSLEERPADSRQRDLKERIKLLNKEVSSLQHIIEQSCCALSCCVDEEHGKGTRQEAEAERLLLVSTEKKNALLKDLNRLREHSGEPEPELDRLGTPRPCRASVTISNIQLPLKVDYVCTTVQDSDALRHYFLILIRYGSHDVVATSLASAADTQTGDTIVFPTTVTLDDAESDFRIEIEVYSLAQSGSNLTIDKRKSLKPKITPKKLLSSRKPSLISPGWSPALNGSLKSSSFLLVGSLTLSLDSLGRFKFPLEKMKLEGKVGRLLGNHFQDKVPFLSPLEGSLHLKIQCQSHSAVRRSGFLTTFEDVSGLGSWHRRWCVLLGNTLSFWDYPDQEALKDPLRRINLVNCTSAEIEAVRRETCARPHTLELITMRPQQEDDTDTLVTQCRNTLCFTKNWLSADTKEEKAQWMDSLNQVLLDLRTWGVSPAKVTSICSPVPVSAPAVGVQCS